MKFEVFNRAHTSVVHVSKLGSLLLLGALLLAGASLVPVLVEASPTVNAWWPTDGSHVTGLQPFKAEVQNTAVETYSMTWSVDSGQENDMSTNYTDAPHKEASVDVSSWNWHGAGPYAVTFTAKNNGSVLATRTVNLYVDNGQPAVAQNIPAASIVVAPAPVVVTSTPNVQIISPAPVAPTSPATSPASLSITSSHLVTWWPVSGAYITGVQPFKGLVTDRAIDSYKMTWSVDGGQENDMSTNYTDAPHKEASVDVSSWNWHGAGPYLIRFKAQDQSGLIASVSFPIYIGNTTGNTLAPVPTPAPAVTTITPTAISIQLPPSVIPSVRTPVSGNPLSSLPLYVSSNSAAAAQARTWQSSNPAGAILMNKLAQTPTAVWLGEWSGDIKNAAAALVQSAAATHTLPVMIAYNIPNRDCSGYSAGGATTDADYLQWIASLASGIGSSPAAVILEPDGLANVGCLSATQLSDREALLKKAVGVLKANANTHVYIDAGHSNWVNPGTIASRLMSAGEANADGFSLNVSNFMPTAGEIAYGTQVSSNVGGKHFVIDTSRNGNGALGSEWCNPAGRAVGQAPTASTGNALVDAFLWLKTPGESDGTCNGGPSAGTWWPSYALALLSNW